MQDKAGLIMAATGRDLAKRLAAAVSAVTALSEAELREERQSEESGEEASVLQLALRRVAALLHASGAPAQEPATLKPLQKLLAVSSPALPSIRGTVPPLRSLVPGWSCCMGALSTAAAASAAAEEVVLSYKMRGGATFT